MKYFLLLILYSVSIFPQNNSSLSGKEIRASHITRLSHILTLNPNLHLFTTDNYRMFILDHKNYKGLYNPDNIILIDDIPVEINLLGYTNLNLIPLHTDIIDSVVFIDGQFLGSSFNSNSVMNLVTNEIKEGISIYASYTSGNESGDPGPYVYTKFRSANVDEIGPDINFSLSGRSKNISARLNFVYQVNPATDSLIVNRNKDYEFNLFNSRLAGLLFQLNTKFENSNHRLIAGTSKTGDLPFTDNYGSDLFFLTSAAKEIPVETDLNFIGLNSKYILNDQNSISNTISFNSSGMDQPDIFEEKGIKWRSESYKADISYLFKDKSISLKTGGFIDYFKTFLDDKIEGDDIFESGLFGQISFDFSNSLFQSFFTKASLQDKQPNLKLKSLTSYRINPNEEIGLSLNFQQGQNSSKNNLWYWVSKGYSLLDSHNVNYRIVKGDFNSYQVFLAEIFYTNKFSKDFSISVSGWFNYTNDLAIEKNKFEYINEEIISDFTEYRNGTVHATSGLNISILHNSCSKVTHRLDYISYDFLFSSFYAQDFEKLPGQNLYYTLNYHPWNDMSIWLNLLYRSDSYWGEYEFINDERGYSNRLNNNFIVNAAVKKTFWQKRFKVSLIFRNLLGEDLRYHPLSGINDFSFFLKLSFSDTFIL